MKNILRKEVLTIELEDIQTDSGEILSNMTSDELAKLVKHSVENALKHLKAEALIKDREHEFLSFNVDDKVLARYSESPEVYPHFVYHHYRNYHNNSVNSRHYNNGGHWEHSTYDPTDGWHLTVIENMKNGVQTDDHTIVSIKDSVLINFYSAGVIRMYGTDQYFKTICKFASPEQRKKFFDYILDSGMVNINTKETFTTYNPERADYRDMINTYTTLGEAFLYHCIRNKDLETFKYLVEEKGLDLYEIDKHPYEKWLKADQSVNERGQQFYSGHNTSFLFRLIGRLCASNWDHTFISHAAPCLHPNGQPVSADDVREQRYREDSKPRLEFLRSLFSYITETFPNLETLRPKDGT